MMTDSIADNPQAWTWPEDVRRKFEAYSEKTEVASKPAEPIKPLGAGDSEADGPARLMGWI